MSDVSVQLAILSEKIDGVDTRINRFEEQQNANRKEFQSIIGQIAGIAATCKLHVEQTNSATSAAASAIRIAEEAKITAKQVESSWHDIRKMSRKPGTSEHQSVTSVLEERDKLKRQERENLESTVSNIVLDVFAKRDKAEREAREAIYKDNEEKRRQQDARMKRISWTIGLIITIIGTLSSMGFWNLYSESQTEKRQIIQLLKKEVNNRNGSKASTSLLGR